jgi:hypothetical protein
VQTSGISAQVEERRQGRVQALAVGVIIPSTIYPQ